MNQPLQNPKRNFLVTRRKRDIPATLHTKRSETCAPSPGVPRAHSSPCTALPRSACSDPSRTALHAAHHAPPTLSRRSCPLRPPRRSSDWPDRRRRHREMRIPAKRGCACRAGDGVEPPRGAHPNPLSLSSSPSRLCVCSTPLKSSSEGSPGPVSRPYPLYRIIDHECRAKARHPALQALANKSEDR